MKAYTDRIKKLIAVSSLALVTSTGAVWAQNAQDTAVQPSQDQSTIINAPRAQAPESPSYLPQERDAQMQSDAEMRSEAGRVIDEPAGADNEGRNWTWLGLLGLLGLFGLKGRNEVHETHYRPVRP